jgi:RNA polymerase sigma-70 factor (ECF subfamily)
MKRISPQEVETARSGSAADVERLLQSVWPEAYRLAYSVLGQRQGAEDAAQEACITIYRSIGSLRSTEAFPVWIYRIVVRAAMDVRRRAAGTELSTQDVVTFDGSDAIDVWRALQALPPDLRAVVVLRYFEQLNSREIAAILRVPDGTVRFRLNRAKQRLRPLLEDEQPFNATPNEVRIHAV